MVNNYIIIMPLSPAPSNQTLDIYKILNFVKLNVANARVQQVRNTVFVHPDNLNNSMGLFNNIYNLITTSYPNNTYKKTITEGLGNININRYNSIKVELPITKVKTPQVLKPGEAYELYFKSVILDGLGELQELREQLDIPENIFNVYHNLTLNLYDSDGMKASIGPITGAEKVGQLLGKSDVDISVRNKPKVKISLKQSNFSFWSSAATYTPRPLNVLNSAISSGKVIAKKTSGGLTYFDNNVGGIRVPATIDEVQKFCFGGLTGVDYIVINGGNVRKGDRATDNKLILQMTAEKIYRNKIPSELTRMQPDVFLIIKANSDGKTASGLSPYRGLTIHFVNKRHAYDPQNNYVDG
jgi:hypothetical protein